MISLKFTTERLQEERTFHVTFNPQHTQMVSGWRKAPPRGIFARKIGLKWNCKSPPPRLLPSLSNAPNDVTTQRKAIGCNLVVTQWCHQVQGSIKPSSSLLHDRWLFGETNSRNRCSSCPERTQGHVSDVSLTRPVDMSLPARALHLIRCRPLKSYFLSLIVTSWARFQELL